MKKAFDSILIFAITILIYYFACSKSIYIWDSLDLTNASYFFGIPHPTGYPLYTVLGFIATYIFPSTNVAFIMNFLSSIYAATAVLLLYKIVLEFNISKKFSFIFALNFAISKTFFDLSTIAEVYSLSTLFILLNLYLLIKFSKTKSKKWLFLFSLTYAISITHHLTMIMLLPAYLYYLYKTLKDKNIKLLKIDKFWMILLILIGFSIWIYLPISSYINRGSYNSWTNIDSFKSFYNHISGKLFHNRMFALPFSKVVNNLKLLILDNLKNEISLLTIFLFFIGFYNLIKKRHFTILIFLFYIILSNTFYCINYDVIDIEQFFIPTILSIVFVAAFSFFNLRKFKFLSLLILLLNLALLFHSNYNKINKSNFRVTELYAKEILKSLPKEATIYIRSEISYILSYFNKIYHLRPDVKVLPFVESRVLREQYKAIYSKEKLDKLTFLNDKNIRMLKSNSKVFFTEKFENSNLELTPFGYLYKTVDNKNETAKFNYEIFKDLNSSDKTVAWYVFANLFNNRGIFHEKTDPELSKNYFNRVIKISNFLLNSNDVMVNANNLYEFKMFKAVAYYLSNNLENCSNIQVYMLLAKAYNSLEDVESEKNLYIKMIKSFQNHVFAYEQLIEFYFYNERPEKAVEIINKAIKNCENNSKFYFYLSKYFYLKSNSKESIKSIGIAQNRGFTIDFSQNDKFTLFLKDVIMD